MLGNRTEEVADRVKRDEVILQEQGQQLQMDITNYLQYAIQMPRSWRALT